MSDYANPLTVCYSLGEFDFGATNYLLRLAGIVGKQGVVKHVQVAATETFTADTTSAKVKVGVDADADQYALLDLGTTAAAQNVSDRDQPAAIKNVGIPADTDVRVELNAPTGGTPAGKGHVFIIIDWF